MQYTSRRFSQIENCSLFELEQLLIWSQTYITDTVVTELLPGKRTAWRGTKSAFPVNGWREVNPVGNRSQVIYNLNTEFSGVMKLLEPFIRNSFEKRAVSDLARLKQLLESQ